MAQQVIWTRIAWTDLERAADYIAADSTHYAAAFVRSVRDAARSLRRFPNRGRVVPEFQDPTVRETFVQNFRLIYRVTGQSVFVIALVHGARDLRALWEREARS